MAGYSHLDGIEQLLNFKDMFNFMQIIISAAAAAIISSIHISYGMLISMETSWISWLEMVYRVNQWALPPIPDTAKKQRAGGVKAKIFLAI